MEMLPLGAQGHFERIRVSGAFIRDGGEWHLAQIHLSPAAPPPPDTAAADSMKADSAKADSMRATRPDSTRKASRSRPAPKRGGGG
jgi:hypothetical protein